MYSVHCSEPWQEVAGSPTCPGTLLLDAAPWYELSVQDAAVLLPPILLVLATAWGVVQIGRLVSLK